MPSNCLVPALVFTDPPTTQAGASRLWPPLKSRLRGRCWESATSSSATLREKVLAVRGGGETPPFRALCLRLNVNVLHPSPHSSTSSRPPPPLAAASTPSLALLLSAAYLSVCLSVCLPVGRSVRLSVCQSVPLSPLLCLLPVHVSMNACLSARHLWRFLASEKSVQKWRGWERSAWECAREWQYAMEIKTFRFPFSSNLSRPAPASRARWWF